MSNSSEAARPRWLVEMTEEQVREVYGACEFLARVRMGQFEDLLRELTPKDQSPEEASRTYLILTRIFDLVKLVSFPKVPLSQTGTMHDVRTERIWDMYVAMRNTLARKNAELTEDDDPTSRFLVSRDDPAHRMLSDWPMVKMTYVPNSPSPMSVREYRKTQYVVRLIGTGTYYVEETFGNITYTSLDKAYLFDDDKMARNADEEVVAVTVTTRIEVKEGAIDADGGAGKAGS